MAFDSIKKKTKIKMQDKEGNDYLYFFK